MLLFGIYTAQDNDAATAVPERVETTRPHAPGTLTRAFVLCASPDDQKQADNDIDLRRLNQLLEQPSLRNLWSIQVLAEALEKKYGGKAPDDGVVYAVVERDARDFDCGPDIAHPHNAPVGIVSGFAATAETAAKLGHKTLAYKIGGGPV